MGDEIDQQEEIKMKMEEKEDELLAALEASNPISMQKDDTPSEIVVSGEDVNNVRERRIQEPKVNAMEVEKTPIQPTIREVLWHCNDCQYEFKSKATPRKCPNCKKKNVVAKRIEEESKNAPKLNPKMLKPLVAMPFQVWSERADMPELALCNAEIETLSENLAVVMDYYMADLTREHGPLTILMISVAIITVPRTMMYLNRKQLREEIQEKENPMQLPAEEIKIEKKPEVRIMQRQAEFDRTNARDKFFPRV